MGLSDWFKKDETLVAVDIGTSSIKIVEVDWADQEPVLTHFSVIPTPPDIFQNNVIVKSEEIGGLIAGVFEQEKLSEKRVVISMPTPSAFTKRIKMSKMSLAELDSNVRMEAANFIPHSIDAVHLDYHILGESGRNQLEVLVVAVKNEVVSSFLDSCAFAGLESAVAEVDCFALQNAFEALEPELIEKTVALINVGQRYSTVNICKGGNTLFTGDISTGGKSFTDTLVDVFSVSPTEAEAEKRDQWSLKSDKDATKEALERQAETVAAEFNRQLSFYWSASGSEEGIDQIILTGGGAQIHGLAEELKEKTGVATKFFDPLGKIKLGNNITEGAIKPFKNQLSIAIGMSLRQPGDKLIAEGVLDD